MTYYQLTHQEWLKAATSLCPAEKDLYLYLKTLNPFADGELKISVDRIAADLQMHRDTVLRHLRRLREKGWLTYQIHSLIIKFTSQAEETIVQGDTAEVYPEQDSQTIVERSNDQSERSNDRRERSNDRPNSNQFPEKMDVSADPGFTNNRGLNFKPNNLVKPQDEQSGIGQILGVIEAIGIRANSTIQKTIQRLQGDFGPAAAAKRVELAIESLREQSEKGIVNNPGGFLNAALQRCFTPNNDGYRERKSKEKVGASELAPGRSPSPALTSSPGAASSPALPVPPALDLVALQQECDSLILKGHRLVAAERLQEEIAKGNLNAIRSLLRMRRDWGFKLENNRITSPLQTLGIPPASGSDATDGHSAYP